jgi:hypothetical protein
MSEPLYPDWLHASLKDEYKSVVRDAVYLSNEIHNPYSLHKDDLPAWRERVDVLFAQLMQASSKKKEDENRS